ncbi:hypothetical protein QYE76_023584 [Lolium multiflorum]|uniref:Reverse transcriptase domain-containing protein n=1 Tax=Lolium multiflorum TaxID=4521 RepID=A0AAD8RBP2_LOLMU|nr:hypothetical protein QYE76_023584 [Lolium multiflorum]
MHHHVLETLLAPLVMLVPAKDEDEHDNVRNVTRPDAPSDAQARQHAHDRDTERARAPRCPVDSVLPSCSPCTSPIPSTSAPSQTTPLDHGNPASGLKNPGVDIHVPVELPVVVVGIGAQLALDPVIADLNGLDGEVAAAEVQEAPAMVANVAPLIVNEVAAGDMQDVHGDLVAPDAAVMDVLMEEQDIVAGVPLHDLGVEGSLVLVPFVPKRSWESAFVDNAHLSAFDGSVPVDVQQHEPPIAATRPVTSGPFAIGVSADKKNRGRQKKQKTVVQDGPRRFTRSQLVLDGHRAPVTPGLQTRPRKRSKKSEVPQGSSVAPATPREAPAEAWTACYKNRMGTSVGIQMRFDLQRLIPIVEGLEDIVVPFTIEEMDVVVKSMPPDKALGPDGFNGFFMKKCWSIIKEDYYTLAMDFHHQCTSVENINSSYITLVPKTTSPEKINDFRPISLTNTGVKFLSKMVADRLQLKMVSCVHKNQYGFIKGRTIHDCLGWYFEYLHQCKMSKREIVVLKLDFVKAFDSIEHEALYLVLTRMGFPELFISWAKSLLWNFCSVVMEFLEETSDVREVSGRVILCLPYFLLGAELLQYIINDLKDRGVLQLPIPIHQQDFPIVRYADDTILVLQ